MRTRLIAAIAALLLAAIGGVLVTAYVQAADQRALAGAKAVDVLVVAQAIPAGTPADQLGDLLVRKAIPQSAVAADALPTLAGTEGKVTAVDLVPAEQLLASRLIDPKEMQSAGTVAVPEGLQEVTLQLGPDRLVGARLAAGDTVGVFVTFDAEDPDPAATEVLFHKVLITSIQGAPVPSEQQTDGATPPVPEGAMLVTFARTADDAAKLIFAAEYGSIWLTKQPDGVGETDNGPATRKNLFQ